MKQMEVSMNIKVFYYSKTGNTKKVAEAMAAAAGCEALPVDKAHPTVEADLLLIGGAIYAKDIHSELRRFIDSLDSRKIKRAAVFCTSVMEKKAIAIMKSLLEAKGISVEKESFSCNGKFLWKNPGHPNNEDLDQAKEFVARMLS
jgi:flavodoxin